MSRFLKSLRRPFSLLWAHRWRVLLGLACLPLHAAAVLAMPRLIGDAIDGLRASGTDPEAVFTTEDLGRTCLVLLGLALAEALTRYLSRRTLIDASRDIEEQLKNQLMTHLSRLPIAWHDRARTGDLVSRMTQDVELVRFLVGPVLLHGGSALFMLPVGLWLMATLDTTVTVACGSAFAVLFVALRFVMPRLHRHSKAAQEAIGDLSQRAQEDFAGIRVLTTFGADGREREAMARRNRRFLVHNLRLTRLRALVNVMMRSTSSLVLLGVLLVGGHQVVAGSLTVGELFQFVVYLGMMLWPLQVLGWTLSAAPRALAAAERLEEIFEVQPESDEGSSPAPRGRLSVRNLTFTYPGQQRPALRDVSFDLEPGEKLGLAGPVGSGKSTLLALCLRFYDPPRGTVFLDDADVLDIEPGALREAFAFAPQEPFLFSDTIERNVAFAHDELGGEDLDLAVRTSALDQDMEQFRDGLSTVVGERGVTLSGGQKQRVSLARAMAANRQALLLDDTLSAVDPATERRILQGLADSRGGRTLLVASHRLSVLADADLILVLDEGRVREHGTHSELLALDGLYAAAWRRQSEERALEGPGED